MPVASQRTRQTVPARPLYSTRRSPPGVYRSIYQYAQRWVYYVLGRQCELLKVIRPEDWQTDEEVVATLLALPEPRVPALFLVNADTISAAGLDPVFHRPLSLPRLVR